MDRMLVGYPPWKIRWIFFDAVGTLFRVRGSVGKIYSRHASYFGFVPTRNDISYSQIDRAFSKAFQEVQTVSPLVAMIDLRAQKEWWYNVVRRTFAPLGHFPEIESFFESVYDLFGTAAAWELEPWCRQVLELLKLSGQRLGIISNFDTRIFSVLESLGIRESFELVVVSAESPYAKPDHAMFRMVVEQVGVPPDQCLHVGDHLKEDYEAAQAAGLQAILYDCERCLVDRVDHRVDNLKGIRRFLL